MAVYSIFQGFESRGESGSRPGAFPSASHSRFRVADRKRAARQLLPWWSEVFHGAFARLGLGLGWAIGVAQLLGVGEGAALAASIAALCLLVLSSLSVILNLPSPGRFPGLVANLDSLTAWRMVGLWACTALFLVNVVFLTVFPSAHRFFLALLGLEMLALCPAALWLFVKAMAFEPRPHWKWPALPGLAVLSSLSVGCLLLTGYGFILGGDGYGLHLVFALLLMTGHAVLAYFHFRFLISRGRDGGERLWHPPGGAKVKASRTLAILIPMPLAFAGLLLPWPWRLVFLLAPLCAAAGVFLDCVLAYVPEFPLPHDYAGRVMRKV